MRTGMGSLYKATSQPDLRGNVKDRTFKYKKHSVQSTFEPIPEDGLMKQNKKRLAASSTEIYREGKHASANVMFVSQANCLIV